MIKTGSAYCDLCTRVKSVIYDFLVEKSDGCICGASESNVFGKILVNFTTAVRISHLL